MIEELEKYKAAKQALNEKANQIRYEALVKFYKEQGHQEAKAREIASNLMKEVW